MEEQTLNLNERLVQGETPVTKPFRSHWDQQVKKAKAIAREYGFEVLTPLAAVELFGIPAATQYVRLGEQAGPTFHLP